MITSQISDGVAQHVIPKSGCRQSNYLHGFTALNVSHNMIDHSLKGCRRIFHSERHNPVLGCRRPKFLWREQWGELANTPLKGQICWQILHCQFYQYNHQYAESDMNPSLSTDWLFWSLSQICMWTISDFGTRMHGELHSLLLGSIMLFSNIIFYLFI